MACINRKGGAAAAYAVALCVALVLAAGAADAAGCNPSALSPCMSAIMLGAAPSPGCCVQLRAQQPCLCQYARDPSYRSYVTSPSAQRAVKACNVKANC
ncbi:non-specific lipid-transfer protein 2P-like [Oryza glaberrima]|uniref:Bifunctional inhibitor/plant lipid transfer protein/seed storage helical domain-containing protein n=1 Tax=Oryza glaberrima TaxID=4538 RepID=I1Q531_ORYGL|nr:non-specific lipid-transfer protein 2P-like [Oryza glaberrima]